MLSKCSKIRGLITDLRKNYDDEKARLPFSCTYDDMLSIKLSFGVGLLRSAGLQIGQFRSEKTFEGQVKAMETLYDQLNILQAKAERDGWVEKCRS